MENRPSIFENPEEFERYEAAIARRLREKMDERRAFLSECEERLRDLHSAAEVLGHSTLTEELAGQLGAIRQEFELLANGAGEIPADAGDASAPSASEPSRPAPAPAAPTAPPPGPSPAEAVSVWTIPPAAPAPQPEPEPPTARPEPEPDVDEEELSPAGYAAAPPVTRVSPVPDWDMYFSGGSSRPQPPGAPVTPNSPTHPITDPGESAVATQVAVGAQTAVADPPSPPPAVGLALDVLVGDREWRWTMRGNTAVLGRRDPKSPKGPDVDLWPDRSVSRRHAQIVRRSGTFFVKDLGSSNGTQLNEEPLTPNAEAELQSGDYLVLGEQATLRVRLEYD